jgi:hypothetical protein
VLKAAERCGPCGARNFRVTFRPLSRPLNALLGRRCIFHTEFHTLNGSRGTSTETSHARSQTQSPRVDSCSPPDQLVPNQATEGCFPQSLATAALFTAASASLLVRARRHAYRHSLARLAQEVSSRRPHACRCPAVLPSPISIAQFASSAAPARLHLPACAGC